MQVWIYAGANDSTVPNFGVVDAVDVSGRAAVFGIPRAVLLIEAERGERRLVLPHLLLVEGGIVPRPSGALATSSICCT